MLPKGINIYEEFDWYGYSEVGDSDTHSKLSLTK